MSPEGLYCPAGDFYIDPRGQVERALVTHAHSDHARSGHKSYLVSKPCLPLLKLRLGQDVVAEGIDYGATRQIGGARVSFHPAGHILGSAQVRVEVNGRVWVVSGDYKPQPDRTCESFDLVKCDVFVSECTFGLPVYNWENEEKIHQQINQWWKENADNGKPSMLFAYSLGKAQRVYLVVWILQSVRYTLTLLCILFFRFISRQGCNCLRLKEPMMSRVIGRMQLSLHLLRLRMPVGLVVSTQLSGGLLLVGWRCVVREGGVTLIVDLCCPIMRTGPGYWR